MVELEPHSRDSIVDRWSVSPVLVTTAPFPQWHRLLRWAAQDAGRRGVTVVVASAVQAGEVAMSECFATALAALRKSKPRVQVRAIPARSDGSDLLGLSGAAGLVVTSAAAPHICELVMDADCPIVVVPDRESPPDGPVVLGVAPWTAEIVVESGFREAALRGVPLEAVRVWPGCANDAGRPGPLDPGATEAVARRLRRELKIALSFCAGRYPSVDVRPVFIEGRTAPELRRRAEHAQLLVLGRSVRSLELARRVGSPIEDTLRDPSCPVVVVPADGRRTHPRPLMSRGRRASAVSSARPHSHPRSVLAPRFGHG